MQSQERGTRVPAEGADLGMASQVQPDALGVPGQRRFRLLVEAQGGSACLWLEKDQLLQLGIAIKRLLAEMSPPAPSSGRGGPPSAVSAPSRSPWEMRITSLSLGQDRARSLFMLAAEGVDADGNERPGLRFWVASHQLDTLADEAFRVCAAGRPLCPLCGASINQGEAHVCVRRNGHHDSVEFREPQR